MVKLSQPHRTHAKDIVIDFYRSTKTNLRVTLDTAKYYTRRQNYKKILCLFVLADVMLTSAACGKNFEKNVDSEPSQNTEETGEEIAVVKDGDVIYQDDDLKIVSKGIEESNLWDGELEWIFEVTNSRKNMDISITAETFVINGVECEPNMYSEVKRNSTAVGENLSSPISDSKLKDYVPAPTLHIDANAMSAASVSSAEDIKDIQVSFSISGYPDGYSEKLEKANTEKEQEKLEKQCVLYKTNEIKVEF